jgi:hypothetical protein
MTTAAITYRTGERASDLRTVIVEDAHTVVMVSGSGMDLLAGKLLHGTQCAHSFWDEQLGTEGDDFVVPASAVVAQRPIQIAAKVVRHK